MSRLDEYREHLRSAAWSILRVEAVTKSGGLCSFCGAVATQVHHVKYPKTFREDEPRNLIPVCDRCHRLAHGGPDMRLVKARQDVIAAQEPSPNGVMLRYAICDGAPWARVDEWCAALQYPSIGHLRSLLFAADRHLAGLGVPATLQVESASLWRWAAVDQALRVFDRDYHRHGFKNHGDLGVTTQEWDAFARQFDRLRIWGSMLAERALVADARARTAGKGAHEAIGEALRAISGDLSKIHDTVSGHDQLIAQLQTANTKDGAEHLTARVAVQERGLDSRVMPLLSQGNRQNWDALVGSECADAGCTPGPSLQIRLDGVAKDKPINTWRRSDLYSAIDRILQRADRKAS